MFVWLWLVGCTSVTEEDCGPGEAYVEDACQQCGNAGGCARSGPACLPTCDDTAAFDCRDGVRRAMCD